MTLGHQYLGGTDHTQSNTLHVLKSGELGGREKGPTRLCGFIIAQNCNNHNGGLMYEVAGKEP
jgi:hypothetical protein